MIICKDGCASEIGNIYAACTLVKKNKKHAPIKIMKRKYQGNEESPSPKPRIV
jgi:hypothetical protein